MRLRGRRPTRRRGAYRGSRFAIADVERRDPPERMILSADEDGLALIVRDEGHPSAFLLHDAAPEAVIDVRALLGTTEARGPASAHATPAPEADGPPAITVAVCTHDRPDLLRECLDAVRELPGAGELDVLVVDNAPGDDATRRLVEGRGDVRYAMEPVAGLDLARNRALAEARGAFVAFLDDDAIVDAGWLEGLRTVLADHPDAAAVTGPVLPRELASPAQIAFERRGGFIRGLVRTRYEGGRHPGRPFFPCDVGGFGAGCNMVVRRSAAIGIGGFDEALDTGAPLPGGGDIDMFFRVIRHAGPLVYEPRLLVFHRHRDTHAGLRRQYWTWGVGFAAFAHKTLRDDPPMRGRMLRMLRWWFGYMLREVRGSLRPGSGIPPSLPTAELLGGLAGILTAYPASRRRMRRLHATHAAREDA